MDVLINFRQMLESPGSFETPRPGCGHTARARTFFSDWPGDSSETREACHMQRRGPCSGLSPLPFSLLSPVWLGVSPSVRIVAQAAGASGTGAGSQ